MPVVNVASCPQRSPFRYPGGKTWLTPFMRSWLSGLPRRPERFVDLFAGGGSMALLAAAEGFADEVVMVELDPEVAGVWRAILEGGAEDLVQQILAIDFTLENVVRVLDGEPSAFQTIVKNRARFGGTLAPGASLLVTAETRGLAARWYPETLARRIRDIAGYADRVRLIEGDALAVLSTLLDDQAVAIFIDPPYTAAKKRRLYRYNEIDHVKLFELASGCAGDILMTYDNTDEVKHLCDSYGLSYQPIAMSSLHHVEMTELVISLPSHELRISDRLADT